MTEREKLLLVRGVTERVVEMLDQAGYKTVEQLYSETDVDRLAISTGLDQRRAAAVREGVVEFVEHERQG
jgi:predicted RecB family nuclease